MRRVVGSSMLPGYRPGNIIVASKRIRRVRVGQVVIIQHNGTEKLKRISQIDGSKIFVLGDNPASSTDSRQFGWIDSASVRARIVWPVG